MILAKRMTMGSRAWRSWEAIRDVKAAGGSSTWRL
jgi:hypothetical protein